MSSLHRAAALATVAGAARVGEQVTVPLNEYVSIFDSVMTTDAGERVHRHVHVTEYYGTVRVGEPAQSFDVVFDTGSGNLVLPTSKCTDQACVKHRRYQSTLSKSAVQLAYEDDTVLQKGEADRDTTTITYGTGKLTGEYVRDNVCFGPATGACTSVDFLGVTQESQFPFTELPFDGIFGLGLSGLSAGPSFNFASRLRTNSSVNNPIFAFFLRNLDAEEDSEVTFGGYKRERISDGSSMVWLPMPREEADDKGYWLVTMRDILVNDKPLGACQDAFEGANSRCSVAMDTGTSLTMAPAYQVNQVMQAVNLDVHCSNFRSIPTLKFRLDAADNKTFDIELNPEDYAEQSEGTCATAFQAIQLPPTLGQMWVFGQSILRKYYTVYDYQNSRVGISLAKHTPQKRAAPTTTTTTAVPQHEKCEDEGSQSNWQGMPGCKEYKSMGYCQRFKPMAHRYCRLSCELCTARESNTATAASDVPKVKGSGMSISAEKRIFFGKNRNAV